VTQQISGILAVPLNHLVVPRVLWDSSTLLRTVEAVASACSGACGVMP
jgi:hypothetical protein